MMAGTRVLDDIESHGEGIMLIYILHGLSVKYIRQRLCWSYPKVKVLGTAEI